MSLETTTREGSFQKAINGKIWMNEEKGIQIRKVRCYTPTVTNPIELKPHRDPSDQAHKRSYYVTNETNFGMAIYERTDMEGRVLKRKGVLINQMDAAKKYGLRRERPYKAASLAHLEQLRDPEFGLPKVILRKGMLVLLYDQSPDELRSLSPEALAGRLFRVKGMVKDVSLTIKLIHQYEARQEKDLAEHMKIKGPKSGKNIGHHQEFPYIKLSPQSFDALVEGIDFELLLDGTLKFCE